MAKTGIIGSGTWGTALAIHLARIGHEVTVWSAFSSEIEALKASYRHPNLPNAVIPETVSFTDDLENVCTGKDLLVLAVPSVFTRSTAAKMNKYIRYGQLIVNVAKGIEEDTLFCQTEITKQEIPQAEVSVLSGPSHAEEVSVGLPTAVVVGSERRETAEYIQNIFMSSDFRVYVSKDIIGIETGGSLKNVIALAAGMLDGLGFGDNTMAALITRGVSELARLGEAMGCSKETFYGLTGIGDLIVTCQSKHSRNRRAGVLMGQGATMEEATKAVNQVVEGIYSAKAGRQLGEKYGVELPIIEAVNKVLFENKSAAEAAVELMTRDKTSEIRDTEW